MFQLRFTVRGQIASLLAKIISTQLILLNKLRRFNVLATTEVGQMTFNEVTFYFEMIWLNADVYFYVRYKYPGIFIDSCYRYAYSIETCTLIINS